MWLADCRSYCLYLIVGYDTDLVDNLTLHLAGFDYHCVWKLRSMIKALLIRLLIQYFVDSGLIEHDPLVQFLDN